MTTTELSGPDWANIARCAEARFKAADQEAMATAERTRYGLLWGPEFELAWQELNTCLVARLLRDKQRNRAAGKADYDL